MKTAEPRVVYEFGPFRLDPAERLLLKEGLPVPLTPKAFDLLVYLAERPGRLVDKHALLSALWPDAVVEEANLAYNVSAVRKALGDGHEGEQFIQTVPTRGYRFVAPVREQRPEGSATPAGPRRRSVIVTAGLAAGLLVAAFAIWPRSQSDRTAGQVVRFELTSIATSELEIPAISPDGTRIVYSAAQDKERQLYVRSLDSLQATPLPGTVGALSPFFSPDGRSIGFVKDRTLITLDLATSQLARVSAVPAAFGATWGRDGWIYFAAGYSGLGMVPAGGGAPQTLAKPRPGEGVHGLPELLPGGRHLLITVWRLDDLDHARVDLLSLDTGHRRPLLEKAFGARYLPTGHLAYLSQSSLFVVGFDARTMQVRGAPVPVLDVAHSHGGEPFFAVSTGGTLVYHPGSVTMPLTEMAWVSGESEQRVTAPAGYYVDPSLSPDDRRLAVAPNYGAHQDIWVHEFARGTWTRLTRHPGFAAAPVWHPADPNAIVFTTVQPGQPGLDLFAMPADGSSPAELLHSSPYAKYAVSSAPAARLVAFVEMHLETRADVWLLDLREKPAARPFLQTPAVESCPALSPDGRWLAYESDESGRMEIYVRPVSGTAGKWVVSTNGGRKPRWSRDDRRILYIEGNRMMTVSVAPGASFVAERPRVLVEARPFITGVTPNYELALDGRLLLVKPAVDQPKIPLIVVQNWFSELREKVGR